MFTDWLTISFRAADQLQVRSEIYGKVRALQRHYPQAVLVSTFGNLSLRLPGQFWQGIEEKAGFEIADRILRWCATAHVTRFDLAHDWSLTEEDAGCIWSKIAELGNVSRWESPAGRTWYVGSRKSRDFGRLYNKRAELRARTGVDIGFPCLRFEVEFKKESAPQMFEHWRRDHDAVQQYVAKKYGLEEYLHGSSTDVIRIHGLPASDPFAFIRHFRKALCKARTADPKLFDELTKSLDP